MSFQYLTAAKLVEAAEKGKSLKSFCASIDNLRKSDYALGLQTLKYVGVIKEILSNVDDNELNEVKKSLLYVMMYEFLFGKGKIHGGGVVKKRIMLHSEEFLAARNQKMEGKTSYEELLSDQMRELQDLPVYLRINEAKITISEGFDMIKELYPEATQDDLIPSLIKLPSDSKGVSQHEFIADGLFVLQDKASCFPSQILFNEYQHKLHSSTQKETDASSNHTYFVDACSAPGNKTSHLAALLMSNDSNNQIKAKKNKKAPQQTVQQASSASIYAFDKSADRAKLLQRRMEQYAVNEIITVKHLDFMSILSDEEEEQKTKDDENYAKVEYVLLDPSCSGSGIVRNIERVMQQSNHKTNNHASGESDEEEEEFKGDHGRVLKLQAFQFSILQKSMSLPSVHTVVYSTCSIHQEENEEVVVKALQSEIGQDWELITPKGFESWERRGKEIPGLTADQASKLIRCVPGDGMNGFFVALFQRAHSSTPRKQSFVSFTKEKKAKSLEVKEVEGTEGSKAQKKAATTASQSASKQANKQNKRVQDSSQTAVAVDHEQPSKKQKSSAGGGVINAAAVATNNLTINKQEKKQKNINANTSTSLFQSRFTVSKTAKRKFHKRK